MSLSSFKLWYEVWKRNETMYPGYEFSSQGRMRNSITRRPLSPFVFKDSIVYIILNIDGSVWTVSAKEMKQRYFPNSTFKMNGSRAGLIKDYNAYEEISFWEGETQ